MRRLMLIFTLGVASFANTGCFINALTSNPNERMAQLLNWSEDLRTISDEWKRIWFTDQPSHLTPDRTHGGIG